MDLVGTFVADTQPTELVQPGRVPSESRLGLCRASNRVTHGRGKAAWLRRQRARTASRRPYRGTRHPVESGPGTRLGGVHGLPSVVLTVPGNKVLAAGWAASLPCWSRDRGPERRPRWDPGLLSESPRWWR